MPLASVGVTRLPTSTWRTPAMPSMGEVTLENWRFSRALFTAAWSRATVARADSTVATWGSYCCWADELLGGQLLVAGEVALGVVQRREVPLVVASACCSAILNGRGSSCTSSSPYLDPAALLEGDGDDLPADPRAHRHRGQRGHVPQPLDPDGHVSPLGGGDPDRHRPGPALQRPAAWVASPCRAGGRPRQHQDDHGRRCRSSVRRRGRRAGSGWAAGVSATVTPAGRAPPADGLARSRDCTAPGPAGRRRSSAAPGRH